MQERLRYRVHSAVALAEAALIAASMPKASPSDARELARLGTDCSFLLTHLIRQDGDSQEADTSAREKLLSILGISSAEPMLRGSSVGWYAIAGNTSVYDPTTGTFDVPGDVSAVCLTESPLTGLRAHRDVFFAKYGIAFDRDYLFERGANACLNIRQSLLKERIQTATGHERCVYNYIPRQLHPFVNIVNASFDATHEREWRFPGDLSFAPTDVRIVFCPEEQFGTIASFQKNGLPMLFDLRWLDRF